MLNVTAIVIVILSVKVAQMMSVQVVSVNVVDENAKCKSKR